MKSLKTKVTISEKYEDCNSSVFREMQKRRTNRSRTLYEAGNGMLVVKLFGNWWHVRMASSLGRCYLVRELSDDGCVKAEDA